MTRRTVPTFTGAAGPGPQPEAEARMLPTPDGTDPAPWVDADDYVDDLTNRSDGSPQPPNPGPSA